MKPWIKPNFFIIGAPKCGTTSLASYLGEHSSIYISNPKEPNYLNTDMKAHSIKTELEYSRCFAGVKKEHIAIGEASVMYLYSDAAIDGILRLDKEAKIIVMLRNPIELCESFHNTIVFYQHENETNFEAAWRLQKERSKGEKIPVLCKDPFYLQYKKIALLGERMEWLDSKIGLGRVHIILMDDFKENIRTVYDQTLAFLGVQSDGRNNFPVRNESKIEKYRYVMPVFEMACRIKEFIGDPGPRIGLMEKISKLNTKPFNRPELNPRFRAELIDEFRSDVKKLSKITGRDLSHWMR